MLLTMSFVPELPASTATLRAAAPVSMRYEDLAPDGRMHVMALPHTVSVMWRRCVDELPVMELQSQGVVPILSHLWAEATEAPIELSKPTRCTGAAILAHTLNDKGEVDRILLDIEMKVFGISGRFFGAQPTNTGSEVCVGKAYARHVFSRPFGAPQDRRVKQLDAEGIAPVPPTLAQWHGFQSFGELPPNAIAQQSADDECHHRFGLHQCDTNQHINSLVFPRLLTDSALRRFRMEGQNKALLSRRFKVAYRKPFFAGQEAILQLQSYTADNIQCVHGAFFAAEDRGRPHSHLHIEFQP
jgi:hypothetical protein